MYDDVELTQEAADDLRDIGGSTEKWLIGELHGLRRVRSGELVELEQQRPAKTPRLRWRIGLFVAIVHERQRTEVAGPELVIVVDRVIRRSKLHEWVERQARLADD